MEQICKIRIIGGPSGMIYMNHTAGTRPLVIEKKKNKYPGMYVVGYKEISKKETTMFLPGRVIKKLTRLKFHRITW
ncbi:hypothetical protein DLD82_02655 [Methanospirillum stamsii]|uniref:Uncharacterized protein n=2 Tax=Methanospirillum stamsii TaxID=1277351 RepID=A0A2V2NEG6_9EURY|nr:hypothetical protein DLD82_02655 [Methanospirillum stamsii]